MILVVGATGSLGGTITRGLRERGTPVRVLARRQSPFQPLADLGADVAFGDLKDPASLAAACRGVSVVVTTANTARRGGADTVETVDLHGTSALIDAARAAGVQRFVYTSVLGASETSPVPFLAAKGRNEAKLRQSGLTWTILSPDFFQEWWPLKVVGGPAASGHPVTIVGEGRKRHTWISEGDVAAFGIAAAALPAAANRQLPLGGPEALSFRDVIAVYERILGRALETRFVQPGEAVPGVPAAVQPLLAALDTYETTIDTTALARDFGVTLTSLETSARRALAGAGTGH
jgi:uncharacterized protein YbjT (DUF2867 family)